MSKKNKKKNRMQNSTGIKEVITIGSDKKIANKYTYSACHKEAFEIIDGLYVGSHANIIAMVKSGFKLDTLVPLNSLSGAIWEYGFDGEILYYPIEDYSVLPDVVLDNVVNKIIGRLANKKKVALFCLGGHGRTGYVAAMVMGKLGIDDPIGKVRELYCNEAVESSSQINHIAKKFNRPDYITKYPVANWYGSSWGYGSGYAKNSANTYSSFNDYLDKRYDTADDDVININDKDDGAQREKCSDCKLFKFGYCEQFKVVVRYTDEACDDIKLK